MLLKVLSESFYWFILYSFISKEEHIFGCFWFVKKKKKIKKALLSFSILKKLFIGSLYLIYVCQNVLSTITYIKLSGTSHRSRNWTGGQLCHYSISSTLSMPCFSLVSLPLCVLLYRVNSLSTPQHLCTPRHGWLIRLSDSPRHSVSNCVQDRMWSDTHNRRWVIWLLMAAAESIYV